MVCVLSVDSVQSTIRVVRLRRFGSVGSPIPKVRKVMNALIKRNLWAVVDSIAKAGCDRLNDCDDETAHISNEAHISDEAFDDFLSGDAIPE